MADDTNPYAKYAKPADENPYAKYKTGAPVSDQAVDVATDVAKSAGPSILRGALGALSLPRGVSDLTGEGVNYLANKFAPQSGADAANKFHNWDTGIGQAFPSYDQLKGETEKDITGPLYQAKTGVGKGVQTGLEVLPSMAAGGEGVLPAVGRSIGAGTLSGLMGSGADYVKSKFPTLPDWVPGVARGVGAVAGGGVAPRAVTPLPMTDARLATVNSLRNSNPELVQASTAGQLTESPRMMGLEARAPSTAGVPGAQEQAYTQSVMRQAGAPGHMMNDAGFEAARGQGDAIRTLQDSHNMNSAEFGQLVQDLNNMNRPGSELYRRVGTSEPFQGVRDQVRYGVRGPPPTPIPPTYSPPLNMTGQRYGALKQIIQNAGEAAPTTHEQAAIFAARDRMKQAFQNSMPPDEAERLRQLDQQYSNYKAIEGIKPKAGEETVTPNQIASRAPRGSSLKEHADQSAQVMVPHPAVDNSIPPAADLTISLLNGLGHGAGAHLLGAGGNASALLGSEGVVSGHLLAPSIYNGAKNVAGRAAASAPVQTWAKNQLWRPEGQFTDAPNREAMVRALAAPQTGSR